MDRRKAEKVRQFIYAGLSGTNYHSERRLKEKPRELPLDGHSVLRVLREYQGGEVTASVLYGTRRDHGETIAYMKRQTGASTYEKQGDSSGAGELALERRRAIEGEKKDVYVLGVRGSGDQEVVEDERKSKTLIQQLSRKVAETALRTLDDVLKEEASLRAGTTI